MFCVTGGGSGLLRDLLTTPGASASVLEATLPYSAPALEARIGKVSSSVDERVAGALGMKALERAIALAQARDASHEALFGFGLTAALETGRRRRGENRAHMSLQTSSLTHKLSVKLAKGAGRQAEEALVSDLALEFLCHALLGDGAFRAASRRGEIVSSRLATADQPLTELVLGARQALCVQRREDPPKALLCGAFDPFHEGHRAMLDEAAERLGCDVALELCIVNADKPPLDFVEIERKVEGLAGKGDLWLTRLPLFSQKADAFAGATFVVGADTMARIGDLRFYRNADERAASLQRLAAQGTRFLVFGRAVQGSFQTLADLDIPESLRALSDGVPECGFRHDISSTVLRKRDSAPS